MTVSLARDSNAEGVQVLRPVSNEVVPFTATAGTTSTPVTRETVVRIQSTEACHVSFTGTATTSQMIFSANAAEYFKMEKGDSVSAIQVATGGNLHVTTMG